MRLSPAFARNLIWWCPVWWYPVDSRGLLHNTTVDRFERTRGFKDFQAGFIRLGSIAHGGLHETFQQLSVESMSGAELA